MSESENHSPHDSEATCAKPGFNLQSSGPEEKQPSNQGGVESPKSGFQKLLQKSFEIPRTMLDPEVCKGVVSRLLTGQEAQVKEALAGGQPAKPFISICDYKKSSKCPVGWDEFTGTDRIRYCERCRLQVYNFDKVELPEAEELVKKRENVEKFVLYKRSDGKFMTSNCPIGAARERNLMFLAAGVLLSMVALFIIASQGPQPQQSSIVTSSQGNGQTAKTSTAREPRAALPTLRSTLKKPRPSVVQLPTVAGNNPYFHKDDDPGAQMQAGLPSGPPGKLPDVAAGANPLYHKDDDPRAQFATGSPHGPAGKLPDGIARSLAGSARR